MNLLTIFLASIVMMVDLNGDSTSSMKLPNDLQFGRTIRMDIAPQESLDEKGMHIEVQHYEAYFDEAGFLNKVVLDQAKNHAIPSEWGINWNASLEEIVSIFGKESEVRIEKKDMKGSQTISSLTDISVKKDQKEFHFYLIDWKITEKKDGFNMVIVESI